MVKKLKGTVENSKARIGIVTAEFNIEVTSKLEEAALGELQKLGVKQITLARVPGAYEIPLAAKTFLEGGWDAVIALGAVIRGETTHYDYVCSSVERGCTQLQLEYQKPVVFGVLTTENEEQAMDRAGGRHGNKGADAARVALEMLSLLEMIKEAP